MSITRNRKSNYSSDEIKAIFYMKEKGYKTREIAEKLKKTPKAISMFLQHYRPLGETAALAKASTTNQTKVDLASLNEALEAVPENTVTENKEIPMVIIEKQPEPVKQKTLFDFPARELIQNLYERGFRIKNNGLVRLVETPVLLKDIISA